MNQMMAERKHSPLYSPIFIYGPPGAGKSLLGQALAQTLNLPFIDLDSQIEAHNGLSIPQIFSQQGEAAFRQLERQALEMYLDEFERVVALGGGALLDPQVRANVESHGSVLCLRASHQTLQQRLELSASTRPLIAGNLPASLADLLAQRAEHYASFDRQLDVEGRTPEELTWQAQVKLGSFHLQGIVTGLVPGCQVRVRAGSLAYLGDALNNTGLGSPVVVVSDTQVAPLYASQALKSLEEAGYVSSLVQIPAGEQHKNMETIENLWASFLAAGVDRRGTIVALGGGVVGDLAGFAAATYMRGINWVCVPTSLLAMVDASLGGKTGADLPQGKNLIGSFHPPRLVLVDVHTLRSLPEEELRSGMAEVVKHGLIADPDLLAHCAQGWEAATSDLDWLVRRAMAVKIQVIEADPYEHGRRAVLNLGHTLGHALERASNYSLRHGEAVAIGLLAACRLAARLGLSQPELVDRVEAVLRGLGLPILIPANLEPTTLLKYIGVDKKRTGGTLRLVLPVRIGEVQHGIKVEDPALILGDLVKSSKIKI